MTFQRCGTSSETRISNAFHIGFRINNFNLNPGYSELAPLHRGQRQRRKAVLVEHVRLTPGLKATRLSTTLFNAFNLNPGYSELAPLHRGPRQCACACACDGGDGDYGAMERGPARAGRLHERAAAPPHPDRDLQAHGGGGCCPNIEPRV